MNAKVKGRYILDTDCEPKKATGINITELANDEVILSFFNDVPSLPEEFEMKLDDNGKKAEERDIKNDIAVTRVVNSRVLMKKEDIIFLFHLLLNKLEEGNDD